MRRQLDSTRMSKILCLQGIAVEQQGDRHVCPKSFKDRWDEFRITMIEQKAQNTEMGMIIFTYTEM